MIILNTKILFWILSIHPIFHKHLIFNNVHGRCVFDLLYATAKYSYRLYYSKDKHVAGSGGLCCVVFWLLVGNLQLLHSTWSYHISWTSQPLRPAFTQEATGEQWNRNLYFHREYSSTNKSRFPIINKIDFECEECRELHDLLMATVLWIFNL